MFLSLILTSLSLGMKVKKEWILDHEGLKKFEGKKTKQLSNTLVL